MLVRRALYSEVALRIEEALAGEGVRITTVRRLALLVAGPLSGRSSVLGRMAAGLWEAAVGTARRESIEHQRAGYRIALFSPSEQRTHANPAR